jgi:hypothetical protein
MEGADTESNQKTTSSNSHGNITCCERLALLAAQHSTAQHSTAQHSTAQHSTAHRPSAQLASLATKPRSFLKPLLQRCSAAHLIYW